MFITLGRGHLVVFPTRIIDSVHLANQSSHGSHGATEYTFRIKLPLFESVPCIVHHGKADQLTSPLSLIHGISLLDIAIGPEKQNPFSHAFSFSHLSSLTHLKNLGNVELGSEGGTEIGASGWEIRK